MAEPKYRGAYLKIRKAWVHAVRTGSIDCHEPICLQELGGRGRRLAPYAPFDLSHAKNGSILGPSHPGCNRSEGATRGNESRAPRFLQLRPPHQIGL